MGIGPTEAEEIVRGFVRSQDAAILGSLSDYMGTDPEAPPFHEQVVRAWDAGGAGE